MKYITGWTEFSGDPELQNGNYLALHITAEDGAVITVNDKQLDSDGLIIKRMNETQVFHIVATKGDVVATDTLTFVGTMEEPTTV